MSKFKKWVFIVVMSASACGPEVQQQQAARVVTTPEPSPINSSREEIAALNQQLQDLPLQEIETRRQVMAEQSQRQLAIQAEKIELDSIMASLRLELSQKQAQTQWLQSETARLEAQNLDTDQLRATRVRFNQSSQELEALQSRYQGAQEAERRNQLASTENQFAGKMREMDAMQSSEEARLALEQQLQALQSNQTPSSAP